MKRKPDIKMLSDTLARMIMENDLHGQVSNLLRSRSKGGASRQVEEKPLTMDQRRERVRVLFSRKANNL